MVDDKDTAALASKWQTQLKLSEEQDKDFIKRGRKVVKRYRDEREGTTDTGKKYNILWSNVRTMLPAVYAKKPKAEASRRYKDADPVGRAAAEILERSLQYEIDQYPDFDSGIRNAVMDRLLPGRGVVWVRFEQNAQVTDDEPNNAFGETSPTDYVFWEDFRHSPARTWEEVTWVGRRVYMARDEGVARFGDEFKDVPLSHEPIGLEDMKNDGRITAEGYEATKKAKVWEIWDKSSRQVCWYAEGYPKLLDCRDDPLGLEGFFPCPKPLFATTTTDTLVPIADYAMYQDQARELDELTQRISLLVKAVKVVGVYDGSQKGVERMLNEGVDNTLIPVDSWAAFAEKGGVKGTIDFLPLDMVLTALQGLYESREACKQVIYEVTGLSDIIRGASIASETATAQQIKSQYASLRLKESQADVARFASDILRIKAQIMCRFYSDDTLLGMSGIQGTLDAEMAPQALALLRDNVLRTFRIQVASDSLVEMDEQAEKEARMEFLQAAGSFLRDAVPMVQQAPELAGLAGEMLMFGVRAFKASQPIEAAFDAAVQQMQQPKEPQPDPEQIKAEKEAQIEQQRIQAEAMAEQARAQADMAIQRARMEMEAQFEQQRMAMEEAAREREMAMETRLEQMRMAQEAALEQFKAQKQAETAITVAQISADATLSAAQESAADDAARD